jgi:spore germination cell wall hydrolase CwlJ-like protein
MSRRWLLLRTRIPAGFGLLAMVASCLPQAGAPLPPTQRPIATVTMINRLALDLPADIAAKLPALVDAAASGAAISAAQPLLALSTTRSPDDAARAIDCLTAAVYYEARSQSDDGQRAVAQVVLNRVRDRAFPDSVCGVVYQGSTRRTGCQFSFTCDGSMAFRRDPASWAHARDVAVSALSGQVYAPVGSATFYHANYVLPWWASSMDRVATVGAHIFYRWRGGLEGALANSQNYSGLEPSLTGRTSPWPGSDGGTAIAAGYAGYSAQEVDSGVLVHRGGATAPAPETAALSAPVPVAPLPMSKRIRVSAMLRSGAGVRVQRGEELAMDADAPAADAPATD